MAEYFMAFILTNSEMKKISADAEDKQIVKRENLTPHTWKPMSTYLTMTMIPAKLTNWPDSLPKFTTREKTPTQRNKFPEKN